MANAMQGLFYKQPNMVYQMLDSSAAPCSCKELACATRGASTRYDSHLCC